MKKSIWISVLDDEMNSESRWFVGVDLNKPIIFKELSTPNGKRIAFTQIIKRWWEFWK